MNLLEIKTSEKLIFYCRKEDIREIQISEANSNSDNAFKIYLKWQVNAATTSGCFIYFKSILKAKEWMKEKGLTF